MSEDDLALKFAEWYANDLRYVIGPRGRGRWVFWGGFVWQDDETMLVFELVRRMCRLMREKLPPDAPLELHRRLGSAKTIAAVERLARSDRRLVVMAGELKLRADRPVISLAISEMLYGGPPPRKATPTPPAAAE